MQRFICFHFGYVYVFPFQKLGELYGCISSPWLRGEVLLKAAVELGVHYADTSDEHLDVKTGFLWYLDLQSQCMKPRIKADGQIHSHRINVWYIYYINQKPATECRYTVIGSTPRPRVVHKGLVWDSLNLLVAGPWVGGRFSYKVDPVTSYK